MKIIILLAIIPFIIGCTGSITSRVSQPEQPYEDYLRDKLYLLDFEGCQYVVMPRYDSMVHHGQCFGCSVRNSKITL